MQNLLIIFFSGGLGSISRYLIGTWIGDRWQSNLPLGTFAVNIIGCFLIGFFVGIIERYRLSQGWSLLFLTGFCGGFTTFSSFIYEQSLSYKEKAYFDLILYLTLSVFMGLMATLLGLELAKK
ncbi:fluoride efflux transporter CrcB [Spirulina sp. 06S082]|uniref:fluoride efflux transporter CrcB n=1 Tax=Spirulina sp. 06S082 TaxID=3110248 RepID=UPI002B206460|nr:fluoride efflux transporter CrcB [Spirulina sp. 06S082]MEA5472054.1 fluoride efflux transporter CrcB [Spirulina sp. 06S082]